MTSHLREGLLRHSILLMMAMQIGNVASTLFQMVMGRTLSTEEYGIFVALMNVILVLASPLQALRTGLAHYASELVHNDRAGDVPRLVCRWAGMIILVVAPVAALLVLAHRPVASFFGLESSTPVYLMALLLAATPFMPLVSGALQGMQAFRWMAATTCSWGVFRLAAGVVLVLLVAPLAASALVAQIFAVVAATALGLVGIHSHARTHSDSLESAPNSGLYFAQSCLLFAGFGILMYSDMIMVRHYLPEQAGWFGYSATIGRTVIFLPMPIAMAMFPKVTSKGSTVAADWRTLRNAIAFSCLIIGGAVGGCLVLPRLALMVMFGIRDADIELIRLLQGVVVAMSPLALVYILMNFEMAQRRFEIVPMALACAVGYVGWVVFHHDSPWDVILALGISSSTFLLMLLATMRRTFIRQGALCLDPHEEHE
jgi:O-antigen/teichoic acid export membrane protein